MKKKNYKSPKGKDINTNTILLVAILILGIVGFTNGWFGGNIFNTYTNTTITNRLDNDPANPSCTVNVPQNQYCSGNVLTASLSDGKNTECSVYIRNSEGWYVWGDVTTDATGKVTRSETVTETGDFLLRAICGNCLTNTESWEVVDCGDDEAPGDEDCAWQEVDRFSSAVPGFTMYHWEANLPTGDFRFAWTNTRVLDMRVYQGVNIKNFDPATTSGSYTFENTAAGLWSVSADNSQSGNTGATITLEQWICPGDDLNWNPGMFDQIKVEDYYGPDDEYCHDFCKGSIIHPYWGGYYEPNELDCSGQGNIWFLDNGCCCINYT